MGRLDLAPHGAVRQQRRRHAFDERPIVLDQRHGLGPVATGIRDRGDAPGI